MSHLVHVLVLIGAKEDFAALHNFVLAGDGSRRGLLRFPEICTMQLHLLSTGSPDLGLLNHVFHSLLAAVHANQRNAALLYDQVSWMTSSSLIPYYFFSSVMCLSTLLTSCSCLFREELKLSCLAFTVFSATPTRPLQVCHFLLIWHGFCKTDFFYLKKKEFVFFAVVFSLTQSSQFKFHAC